MCEALADRQQFLKASVRVRAAQRRVDARVPIQARALPRGALPAAEPGSASTFHRRLAEGLEGLRTPVEPEMAAKSRCISRKATTTNAPFDT